jgi:hypothetical protein
MYKLLTGESMIMELKLKIKLVIEGQFTKGTNITTLQSIFNQIVLIKDIKMPSSKALVLGDLKSE